MRLGVIIATDEAGAQYVYDGKSATRLATVEIGALKDAFGKAVDSGLDVKVGTSKVRMTAGALLTNNGLVKRKKFARAL